MLLTEEYIKIILTDEQVEKLAPLNELVWEKYKEGDPGALIAQVYPEDSKMTVCFVSGEKIKKAYADLGIELPEGY